MTKFVVDANVAVKWVLPEIHSEPASRLLNSSHTLLVPDFFFSEVGNIFWKQVRFGTATLAEVSFIAIYARGKYSYATIKIWNVDTGQGISTLYGHSWEVLSLAFSRDGKTLASGSSDATIKIRRLSE